jgi:anti-sigma factor RsiW
MNQHVPEDLLTAFVDGDVSDHVAAHVAEHLDGCPACATRAASMEPLGPAFATVRDPEAPPHLAASVLDRVAREDAAAFGVREDPDRLPTAAWLGLGLVATASGLLVVTEGPVRLSAEAATMLYAAFAAGRSVSFAVSPFQVSLALGTFVTLVGSLATLHFASTHLLDGREILRRMS